MGKTLFILIAIITLCIDLIGCSSGPSEEEIAVSVEVQLVIAQTETAEAIPADTTPVPTNTSILTPDYDIVTPSVASTTIRDPNDSLVEGWESFDSKNLSLSFLYPKATKVRNNQDGSVSVVRWGPTQTEGTELFDGYALTFSKGNYDTDFLQFVEDFRSISATDPAISETGEITKFPTPHAAGLLFTTVGLGEFDNIFLPLNESEYLFVSRLVSDPQQLGYVAETDTIIFTVNQ